MSTPPIALTNKVATPGASIAALGDADQLKAAFESGTPVTLDGKHAGEVVYLGHTIAAYLVDMTRLDGAPKLAALKRQADAARMRNSLAAEARIEADDARLDRPAEDGA